MTAATGPARDGTGADAGSSAGGRPRRAVVFGGGGVLGYAWMLGALSALESETGIDVRDSEILIGTSAGAAIAALLASGVSAAELGRHHQGATLPGDLDIDWDYDNVAGGTRPPRPALRPGSPRLLASALRHPRRVGPWLAMWAVLPLGRGSLAHMHDAISRVSVLCGDAGVARPSEATVKPWIVATDYRTGARVVFGRDVEASLADAVVASCSIPAWFAPVIIDGVRYIDGGTVSNASCDLLYGLGLDEVYVLMPAASMRPVDPGRTFGERIERRIRRAVTRSVLTESTALRSAGTRVTVLSPTSADLDLIGVNLMNPARRSAVFDLARLTATATLREEAAMLSGVCAGQRDGGGDSSGRPRETA
jgi:NTE family protein